MTDPTTFPGNPAGRTEEIRSLQAFVAQAFSDCVNGGSGPAMLDRYGDVRPSVEADAEKYDLHFFVDGDETLAPFEAIAGRDYELAEPLGTIAQRYADRALSDRALSARIEQIECLVLCCCCGYDLASATAYRD